MPTNHANSLTYHSTVRLALHDGTVLCVQFFKFSHSKQNTKHSEAGDP